MSAAAAPARVIKKTKAKPALRVESKLEDRKTGGEQVQQVGPCAYSRACQIPGKRIKIGNLEYCVGHGRAMQMQTNGSAPRFEDDPIHTGRRVTTRKMGTID
jgi:hypothetical protein